MSWSPAQSTTRPSSIETNRTKRVPTNSCETQQGRASEQFGCPHPTPIPTGARSCAYADPGPTQSGEVGQSNRHCLGDRLPCGRPEEPFRI